MTSCVKSMCSWVSLPSHKRVIDSSLGDEPARLRGPNDRMFRWFDHCVPVATRLIHDCRHEGHNLCSLQTIVPIPGFVFNCKTFSNFTVFQMVQFGVSGQGVSQDERKKKKHSQVNVYSFSWQIQSQSRLLGIYLNFKLKTALIADICRCFI